MSLLNPELSTVGHLRSQAAYVDRNTKVVIVSTDPHLQDLEVVEVYPSVIVKSENKSETVFKVIVRRKP